MSTVEKERVRACAVSPEDLTAEHIAVGFLMKRFTEIGQDGFRDIASLVEQWMDPETSDGDRAEIFDIIREILFPERVGDIRFVPDASTGQLPEKLRRRAEHIGKTIRKIRNTQKISQTDLAKKSGLPQSHISRLETGTHSPSCKTLTKIARALDVQVGDLDPAH